jgi:hypothetical protein
MSPFVMHANRARATNFRILDPQSVSSRPLELIFL